MNQSTNLFIVESPFQLLCALEAKNQFNANNRTILIVKKSNLDNNNNQIKNILKDNSFDKVISVPFFLALFMSDFFLMLLILAWKIRRRTFHTMFIGEIRSTIMRCFDLNFKCIQTLFLDDGLATVNTQNKLIDGISIEEQTVENRFISPIRNFVFRLFFVKYKYSKTPNWYTCFELEEINGQKNIKNNFDQIKLQLNRISEVSNVDNFVYFMGAPISEVNIMTLSNELLIIKKMCEHYAKKEKVVVYCVHRRESEEKLNLISINSNIREIRKAKTPIELDFFNTKTNINHISSFFSTTLITLPLIYDLDITDSVIINNELINPSHIKHVQKMNSKLKKNNLINKVYI